MAHQWQVPSPLTAISEAGNLDPIRIRTSPALLLRVPTIRHVPAALQVEFSSLFADAINRYCDEPSESRLLSVLSMPKLVLRAVSLKGKKCKLQLEGILRARLQSFRQGDLQHLWEELTKDLGGNLAGSKPETRASKRARTNSDKISSATVCLVSRQVADGAPRKGLMCFYCMELITPRTLQWSPASGHSMRWRSTSLKIHTHRHSRIRCNSPRTLRPGYKQCVNMSCTFREAVPLAP